MQQLDSQIIGRGETVPDGFVDKDGACVVLGITRRALGHWISDGKLTCGVRVPSRIGGKKTIYPVEALKQMRADLFARDHLFKGGAGTYQTPAGWVRRREAREMLGVTLTEWEAWARAGILPDAKRFDDGPAMYFVEDLKAMMAREGILAAPYPDPQHPGAVRVPLCGRIGRSANGREAIIDEGVLPLLEGAVLSWDCLVGEAAFVGISRSDKPRGAALRRELMGVTDKGIMVGHINGDPLDCRRENLIPRTIQHRSISARKMKGVKGVPCSSRFKGVCWDKQTGNWRATIVMDGKSRKLGRFRDELAAAQAYDEAARELFGEHAYQNFPHGIDAWLEQHHSEALEGSSRAAA